MNIKLKSLRLKNFKGLKDFSLECKGEDIEIRGDNATGKTTVFDSFLWLLFDKDSEGKKDFEIKTLDENNNPIHKLEHEVEATLEIDGAETTFKKVYKENWVKKRGTKEPELAGHTTDYWIDEVPTKKKDYDKHVNDLLDEGVFKLLTDIRYFTEKINWKERRSIITDIAAVHMDPVKMPSELEELIGSKSLDDFKKIIAEKKKKLKKELEAVPIRIDELNNSLVETDNVAVDSIEFRIRGKIASIKDVENQILDNSKIYEKNNEIKSEIYKKKDQLREIKEEEKIKAQEPRKRLQEEVFKAESKFAEYDHEVRASKHKIKSNDDAITAFDKDVKELRNEWFEKNKEQFDFDNENCTCPTCGQDLPNEDIETKKEKMEKQFNLNKNKILDIITAKGKVIAEKINNYKKENEMLRSKINDSEIKIQELDSLIISKQKELEKITIGDIELPDKYRVIEQEIKALEQSIVQPDEREINQLKIKKEEMSQEVDQLKYSIRSKEQNEKMKLRIEELLEEEKELANKLNELEKHEFDIQEYTMKKINALEETVNNLLTNVEFKMFQEQLNGGVTEICEILINGVPYSSANYAGRINAGLDIISCLSKEYDIYAPVFVDNSESVTSLMDLNQQMIKMFVDGNFKKLAVIEDSKNIKEAI